MSFANTPVVLYSEYGGCMLFFFVEILIHLGSLVRVYARHYW